MEQKEKQKWHLVRNNNGEWICSDQVVYLDDFSTMIYLCGLKNMACLYHLKPIMKVKHGITDMKLKP